MLSFGKNTKTHILLNFLILIKEANFYYFQTILHSAIY